MSDSHFVQPGAGPAWLRRFGMLAGAVLALAILAACSSKDAAQVSYAGPLPANAALRLGKGTVEDLSLSPDGRWLAVATNTGLAFYESETLRQAWAVAARQPIQVVAFSPDGALLAAGSQDGQVSIVDPGDGRILDAFGLPSPVTALGWLPVPEDLQDQADGLLAAGYNNGATAVVQIRGSGDQLRANLLAQLPRHPWSVTAIAPSPDGQYLATGDRTGQVQVWRLQPLERLASLRGHDKNQAVTVLTWLADGETLLSGDRDGRLLLWQGLPQPAFTLLRDEGAPIMALTSDPANSTFSVVDGDGTATAWAGDPPTVVVRSSGDLAEPQHVAWSRDGQRLATVLVDGSLSTWTIRQDDVGLDLLARLEGHTPFNSPVNAVAWSHDGKRLASGLGRQVMVWDDLDDRPQRVLQGHAQSVTAVVWAPDDDLLASGGRDGIIVLWNPALGRQTRILEGHGHIIADLAWSPDGGRLASAGGIDGTVRIWETATGRLLHTITDLGGETLWSVAWSPDDQTLAAGTTAGEVLLWDLAGDSLEVPELRLRGHLNWVSDLAWSPDGSQLASASADGGAFLWDLVAEERSPVASHSNVVRGVAFSPDGRRLATASRDRTVLVWDLGESSGLPQRIFAGHDGGVNAVAWSPDGAYVASGSDDGTVIVWEVSGEVR